MVALLAACTGERPTLLPARAGTTIDGGGVSPHSTAHQVRTRVESPRGLFYDLALTYDPTPRFAATSSDSSCARSAPPGTANHELRLEVRNLQQRSVPVLDLEIYLSAPRSIELSGVTTLWGDPTGCLFDTGTSRQAIPTEGSVVR